MNKLTPETVQLILALLREGLPSRKVAEIVGVSKSTVNLHRNTEVDHEVQIPKVLFFDTETAPTIAAVFGRYDINISQNNVIQDGDWFISAAWKFLGEKTVQGVVVKPTDAVLANDFAVVQALYRAFNEADIVVAHNAKKFDMKMFKARLLMNGFDSLPKQVRVVDTLLITRNQFKFSSNKLDDLGHLMDIGRKKEHAGIQLWIRCTKGEAAALKEMLDYNKQDVLLLERLYLAVRSFDDNAPNLAVYYDDEVARCRICGTAHVHETGNMVYTNTSATKEIKCNNCGALSKTKSNLLSKQKRKNLLAK